jgi:hypothetical protein
MDASSKSDSLYIRGISSNSSDSDIFNLLCIVDRPIDVDLSNRGLGINVKYATIDIAEETINKLDQYYFCGFYISVRFELGLDKCGKHIVPQNSHNTVIRQIVEKRRNTTIPISSNHSKSLASYTYKSIIANQIEFPFPTGLYLSRVIQLTRHLSQSDPLLDIITDPSLGNKYPKEISEAMAMVDCVERALKRFFKVNSNAVVYVLGDGKRPLCAACLCLHFPPTWSYYSIDPILEHIPTGEYSNRFFQHSSKSEDFEIPNIDYPGTDSKVINIVIACHSHAPLAEFWNRVPTPKLAVVMKCCANYCDIPGEKAVFEFDDYEVYSPKRHVEIYVTQHSV